MKAMIENMCLDYLGPAKARQRERISIAGCPVDKISFADVLHELSARIDQKRHTHVVFVNAAKVVRYHQDLDLRQAIDRADILLADGVPIVWASKLIGSPLPGRVNGTDLMDEMLRICSQRGYRVFLLGARLDVLRRTMREILRLHPQLKIAGYQDGYFDRRDEAEIVRQINESQADILLLGMSTPQKELWGDRNLPLLNVAVCQGVGGSFDVLAGVVRRAPSWMQRSGLEWLYRLLQEPRRLWRRYLKTNSAFILLVLIDMLASWKKRMTQRQQ